MNGDKLAVKFLFRPGSTQFINDRSIRAPYDAWIEKIAERTAAKQGCLEVIGHTSATGLLAINDRLSGLRADHIKDRLEDEQRSPRDDASDALDRRVEFKTAQCGGKST